MNNFYCLVKKDLLDQWRSKKMLILAITFLFVALSSVVIAKAMPEILKAVPSTPGLTINLPTPTVKDAIDQFVKNLSQLAIFVLIFLVAGAIVDEKTRKTLELILTKPVSRTSFVLSKFKAYFISITVAHLISSFIFYFYATSVFSSISFSHFSLMATLLLVYLLLVTSVTIFFSTLVNNSILAVAGGFLAMIVFGTVWSMIKAIKDYSPYRLVTEYQKIVANGWDEKYLIPLVLSVILIIIFAVLSILVFRKQEVER